MKRTAAVALVFLLAGCTLPNDAIVPAALEEPENEPPTSSTDAVPSSGVAAPANTSLAPAPQNASRAYRAALGADALEVEIPIPVVLVGFAPDVAGVLAKELDAQELRHATLSASVVVPLYTTVATEFFPMIVQPRYQVHALPTPDSAAIIRAFGAPTDGLYDGNAAERVLVLALESAGLAPRADAPTLVILHGGGLMQQDHAWRYSFDGGDWLGIRAFGEASPISVFDVSGRVDPFVGEKAAFDSSLANDASAAPALAQLVRKATEHRIAQAPVYPVSTKPCHAVTVLGVTRPGSLAITPLVAPGSSAFDKDAVQRALADLTGLPIYVDVKVLQLPVDDPALHAMVATGNWDMLRWWIEQNFGNYWVRHPDCEAYLSVLVDDVIGQRYRGVGLYDVTQGHRTSYSFIADDYRDCMGIPTCGDASPGYMGWATYLVAHETGHLFGLRHPHDVTYADGTEAQVWDFSSVRTAMSYEMGERTWTYSHVDQTNWARARLAALVQEARTEGELDDMTITKLLDDAARQDWTAAAALLAR